MNKYKIDINYAYKMNNVIFYSEEEPSSLMMCLRIGEKCVSSIELVLEDNEDLTYDIKIDSRTLKEYEGNKFNQVLRLIIMIIAQFFPVRISNIHSLAINPISAHLMIKLFKDNEFDETFTKYINKRNITEINYKVIDKYINSAKHMKTDSKEEYEEETEDEEDEDTDNEINIYAPVNEKNITESYTQLYELIGNLPCEINYEEILHHLDPKFVPQHFTQEELEYFLRQPQTGGNILKKCKKYNDKLKQKFSDIYFDKLLFWNTIYLIHKQ
jgi:DNA-binding XRE family transcriptional regulator